MTLHFCWITFSGSHQTFIPFEIFSIYELPFPASHTQKQAKGPRSTSVLIVNLLSFMTMEESKFPSLPFSEKPKDQSR